MPSPPPTSARPRSAGDTVGRITAALTIVAALAIGGAISSRRPPATARGAPFPPLPPPGGRASAYLVAQPRDCSGNLDFLTLFERPTIRHRVTLAAAIAIGGPPAADSVRRALAAHDLHLPVLASTPTIARLLTSLGHRSTPYLFILGPDGAVRYAADAPATRPALRRLAADLERLGALALPSDTTTP